MSRFDPFYEEEFVFRCAHFGQIKDTPSRNYEYFVRSTILNNYNINVWLRDFSNIWIYEISIEDEKYRPDEDDLTWKELLTKKQYQKLKKIKRMIVGYMIVDIDKDGTHWIELFDTVFRGIDIGARMINRYNEHTRQRCIPRHIIVSAARYWAKQLFRAEWNREKGYYMTKADIEEFIKHYNLNKKSLEWEYLYELCNYPLQTGHFSHFMIQPR
jgi:hypothetical protein